MTVSEILVEKSRPFPTDAKLRRPDETLDANALAVAHI